MVNKLRNLIKEKGLIEGNYDVLSDSWYSPIEIIDRFELLRSAYGTETIMRGEFKRAKEMFVGAITLLGAYELNSENKYWLQSNTQGNSPDVVGVKQIEHSDGILLEQTMMEIVEFEEHFPGNDIVDFLLATKLSPKKSYSEHTAIVLMVNKVVPFNLYEIQQRLSKINIKPSIYVIGSPINSNPGDFSISTLNPQTIKRPVFYNINTTASKYEIPRRIKLHLAMDKNISYEKEQLKPVNTFEIMGLDQSRIEAKFKRIS